MSKEELIIFGNSPFLNQVDIPALLPYYTTAGFKLPQYPLDAMFCFDRWADPGLAKQVFYPHYIKLPKQSPAHIPYIPKPSSKPILKPEFEKKIQVFSFKYFSPSIALNWAILQGIKRVYLVGIDHVETDITFAHHDGRVCHSELSVKAHQGFKQYVYECAKHIEVFQCNPAVKKGWLLPFRDLKDLYAP